MNRCSEREFMVPMRDSGIVVALHKRGTHMPYRIAACVKDQPQHVRRSGALRLVEDDTTAIR